MNPEAAGRNFFDALHRPVKSLRLDGIAGRFAELQPRGIWFPHGISEGLEPFNLRQWLLRCHAKLQGVAERGWVIFERWEFLCVDRTEGEDNRRLFCPRFGVRHAPTAVVP